MLSRLTGGADAEEHVSGTALRSAAAGDSKRPRTKTSREGSLHFGASPDDA